MTTLALAPQAQSVRLQPISWRSVTRAARLTHRGLLITLAFVFAALAAAIVVGESAVHASYASYLADGCVGSNHVPCGIYADRIGTSMVNALIVILHVMPLLIGVFVGAPLLARELESGTFRFTWTQAVGRRRQVLVTLALLALIIAVGSCLLGLLMDSYAHPFEVIGQENHWISRLFEDSPTVLAAWSVFALTVGIFAGAVVGRTVAAMAASATVLGAAAVFSYQLVHWLLSFAPTVISHGAPTSNVGVLNSPSFPGFGPSNTWLVRAWLTGPRGAELTEQQSLDLMNRMATAGAFPSGTSAGTGPEKWLSAHH